MTTNMKLKQGNTKVKICERCLGNLKRATDRCECGGVLHDIQSAKGIELKQKKEDLKKSRRHFGSAGARTSGVKRVKNESGELANAISLR